MSSNFLVNVYGTNTDVLSLINTKTVTTVEISTQNPTNQKYNVTFNRQVAIRTGDITVGINGYCLNGAQVYTFGPAQPPLWICVSSVNSTPTGNAISMSTNLINWTGLGAFNYGTSLGACGVKYNGRLWSTSGIGTSVFSFDGRNFNNNQTGSSASSLNIAYNGSMFVQTGRNGDYVRYSYDGINFINSNYRTNSGAASALAWNGYTWILGGGDIAGNNFYTSTDGINWNIVPSTGLGPTGSSQYMVWNGTIFLANSTATANGSNSKLYTSYDGVIWTTISIPPTFPLTAIGWNGSMWVVGTTNGNIYYTYDPTAQTKWNYTNYNLNYIIGLSWNGKYFLMNQNGSPFLSYSLNGIDWIPTKSNVNFNNNGIKTVEYNSLRPHSITIPRYMVIAGGGSTISANCITYSYNGVSWSNVNTSIFNNYCLCIQYNGKIWIAGGGSSGNTLAYSYDGFSWTGLGNFIFQYLCYGLYWNGIFWLACGRDMGNSIAISYDGLIWSTVLKNNVIFSSTSTTGGVQSITSNGSLFVATGTGITTTNCIAYSSNGTTWQSTNQPIFDISNMGQSVYWNGSIWVATGTGSNTIAYSYNGINWTGLGRLVFTTYGWNIAWNGKTFIATGAGGNCAAYSGNGITWTGLGSNPFSNTTGAFGITWDGTRWQMSSTGTTSAYSYDGINWVTYTNSFLSQNVGGCLGSNYGAPPNVYIQHPTVAVGTGQNTIAYSEDGITWKGLGRNIFSQEGYAVAWNGSLWIAVGKGTGNTIAYSQDGLKWTGLGNSIFSVSGNGISWNGTYWVATGTGANTLAYSQNGTYWFGLGSSVFSQNGFGVAWNGTYWVATGQGTNTLAYSPDSINWTGIGTSIFSTLGYGIAYGVSYSSPAVQCWVATGQGTNCLAYTTDVTGATGWTAITTVFGTGGTGSAYGIAWNGKTWVVVGKPASGSSPMIVYAKNVTSWASASTTAPSTVFTTYGLGVCWNGVRFIATGYGGPHAILYSTDAINWYGAYSGFSTRTTLGNIFSTYGNGVASNPGVGAVPIQSQMIVNSYLNGAYSLDIVAPSYYQPGYSGLSVKIEQNNLY